jgi:hypothetical protein
MATDNELLEQIANSSAFSEGIYEDTQALRAQLSASDARLATIESTQERVRDEWLGVEPYPVRLTFVLVAIFLACCFNAAVNFWRVAIYIKNQKWWWALLLACCLSSSASAQQGCDVGESVVVYYLSFSGSDEAFDRTVHTVEIPADAPPVTVAYQPGDHFTCTQWDGDGSPGGMAMRCQWSNQVGDGLPYTWTFGLCPTTETPGVDPGNFGYVFTVTQNGDGSGVSEDTAPFMPACGQCDCGQCDDDCDGVDDVDEDDDGDGIPNDEDDDDDGDGTPDFDDDDDGDGIPNCQDPDDDNDGTADWLDCDWAGTGGGCWPDDDPPGDEDGDGTPDRQDPDNDGDGTPDWLEDPDGDGLPNWQDGDDDGDGTPDEHDPDHDPQDDAPDHDDDGDPDVTDPDDDNDGTPDETDPTPIGEGNPCMISYGGGVDYCWSCAGEGCENPPGDVNQCQNCREACPDSDGDGLCNDEDPDDDNDGVPDVDDDTPNGPGSGCACCDELLAAINGWSEVPTNLQMQDAAEDDLANWQIGTEEDWFNKDGGQATGSRLDRSIGYEEDYGFGGKYRFGRWLGIQEEDQYQEEAVPGEMTEPQSQGFLPDESDWGFAFPGVGDELEDMEVCLWLPMVGSDEYQFCFHTLPIENHEMWGSDLVSAVDGGRVLIRFISGVLLAVLAWPRFGRLVELIME